MFHDWVLLDFLQHTKSLQRKTIKSISSCNEISVVVLRLVVASSDDGVESDGVGDSCEVRVHCMRCWRLS